MTVEENIKYMLLNYHEDYRSARTSELLSLTGLESLEKRKPMNSQADNYRDYLLQGH